MANCLSFTKTSLLIIVTKTITDDWNVINNGMCHTPIFDLRSYIHTLFDPE